jgi:peptidoglycan/LPS O-acetylase OafA/YrhL
LGPLPLWERLIVDTFGQGVVLFFMISGYLIPLSLARHGDAAIFLFDRAIRIFPVYIVIHLLIFVIGPFIGYKFFETSGASEYLTLFAANLIMIAPLLGVALAQQNSWTLTYEWISYLFAALVFFESQRWSRRVVVASVGLLAVISVLAQPICLFFLIGAAYAWTGKSLQMGKGRGAVVCLLALVGMYYCAQYLNYWAAGLFGLVIFGVVLDRKSAFAQLLSTRPLQYMGQISYSFYLFHPVVLLGVTIALHKLPAHLALGAASVPVFAVIGFLVSVAVAAVSYELLETRARRWLHQRFAPANNSTRFGLTASARASGALRPNSRTL